MKTHNNFMHHNHNRQRNEHHEPGVPGVVVRFDFEIDLQALLVREKAHTREGGAISAREHCGHNRYQWTSFCPMVSLENRIFG